MGNMTHRLREAGRASEPRGKALSKAGGTRFVAGRRVSDLPEVAAPGLKIAINSAAEKIRRRKERRKAMRLARDEKMTLRRSALLPLHLVKGQ